VTPGNRSTRHVRAACVSPPAAVPHFRATGTIFLSCTESPCERCWSYKNTVERSETLESSTRAARDKALAYLASIFPSVPATGGRIVIGLAGFLLGALIFGLLAVIEYSAWVLVAPPRPRNAGDACDPPTTADLESTTRPEPILTIAGDGVRLAGLWHPATGPTTARTVLLLHGFAEASAALQALRVATLNRAGWNVAALDLRAYGKSEGLFASFGGREADDVAAWLDALARRFSPGQPLFPVLWGRSMGAAIAVRAAASDRRVRALILESPMVDLDEAMAVWFRRRRAPMPRLLARLATRRAGKLAGVSLTRPRPIDVAPRVRCPVLIVHGSDDTLIPGSEVKRLTTAFPVPPRFIEVPGAGHADVITVGGDTLLEQITRFLREELT
jgi:alpha-beta hydrolase superfamily lysophospholipase